MFKDLYKQANDKINTDAAKNRVMAKLAKPAPVRKSHTMARVAALAACFVLTVAAAGIYENLQKETAVLPELSPNMVVKQVAETDVSEEVKVTPAPTQTPSPKTAKLAQPAKPEFAAEPEIKAENVTYDAVEDLQTDAENQPVSGGGGGGSSAKAGTELVINDMTENLSVASARFALPVQETKPVSVEEYCEYLGNNIPETVVLPEGVENQTFPIQELPADENGEYLEDDFTFLFLGNGKSVQIETTKNTQKIRDIIENPDYTKSVVAGSDALVLEENDIFQAYIAPDDIGYSVTTIGCSNTELEALLISLN